MADAALDRPDALVDALVQPVDPAREGRHLALHTAHRAGVIKNHTNRGQNQGNQAYKRRIQWNMPFLAGALFFRQQGLGACQRKDRLPGGRRPHRARLGGRRAGEKLVAACTQCFGQFLEIVDAGKAGVRLPFSNGLAAHPQLCGQRLLRQARRLAKRGDALPDGHGRRPLSVISVCS